MLGESIFSGQAIRQIIALIRRSFHVRRKVFFLYILLDYILPIGALIVYANATLVQGRITSWLPFNTNVYFSKAPIVLQFLMLLHLFRLISWLSKDESNGMKALFLSSGIRRQTYIVAMLLSFAIVPALASTIFGLISFSSQKVTKLIWTILYFGVAMPNQFFFYGLLMRVLFKSRILIYLWLIGEWALYSKNFDQMYEKTPDEYKTYMALFSVSQPTQSIQLFFSSFSSCKGTCQAITTIGNILPNTFKERHLETYQVLLASLIWSTLLWMFAYYLDSVFPQTKHIAAKSPFFFVRKSCCCNFTDNDSDQQQDLKGKISNEKPPITDSYTYRQGLDLGGNFERTSNNGLVGIEVRDVCKTFDYVPVLHDVVLDAYLGEICLLLGRNGAGKTTLIDIILNRRRATNGSVKFNKPNNEELSANTSIGVCPQKCVLDPDLTVEEHLILFWDIKSSAMSKTKRESAILKTLSDLNLANVAVMKPRSLSEADKRKLSVGLALIGDSRVIVLDEPTAGLDSDSRRQVWNSLRRSRVGKTILMSTHDMVEADYLGDRIAILSSGKIVANGSSLFIKHRFGSGYRLRLECLASKLQSILSTVDHYFPAAVARDPEPLYGDFNDPSTAVVDQVIELRSNEPLYGSSSGHGLSEEDSLVALLDVLESVSAQNPSDLRSFSLRSATIDDVMINSTKLLNASKGKNQYVAAAAASAPGIGFPQESLQHQQNTKQSLFDTILNCMQKPKPPISTEHEQSTTETIKASLTEAIGPKFDFTPDKVQEAVQNIEGMAKEKIIGMAKAEIEYLGGKRVLETEEFYAETKGQIMALFHKLVKVARRRLIRSAFLTILLPLLGSAYICIDLTANRSDGIQWYEGCLFMFAIMTVQFIELPFAENKSKFRSMQLASKATFIQYWISVLVFDFVHFKVAVVTTSTILQHVLKKDNLVFNSGEVYGYGTLTSGMVLFGIASALMVYILSHCCRRAKGVELLVLGIHLIEPLVRMLVDTADESFKFEGSTTILSTIADIAEYATYLLPARGFLKIIEALQTDLIDANSALVEKKVRRSLFASPQLGLDKLPGISAAGSVLNTLENKAKNAASAINSTISSTVDKVSSEAKLIATDPKAALKQAKTVAEKAVAPLEKVASKTANAVQSAAESAYDSAKNTAESVAKTAENAASNIVDTAKQAVSSTTEFIKTPIQKFFDAGTKPFKPPSINEGFYILAIQIAVFLIILFVLEYTKIDLFKHLRPSYWLSKKKNKNTSTQVDDDDDLKTKILHHQQQALSLVTTNPKSKIGSDDIDRLKRDVERIIRDEVDGVEVEVIVDKNGHVVDELDNSNHQQNINKPSYIEDKEFDDNYWRRTYSVVALNISKSFHSKHFAFKDLSFYIKNGECFGFVGLPGCGKSSILSCILGDHKVDSGRLVKVSLTDTGYQPQTSPHFPLTPVEALTLMAWLRDVPSVNIEATVNAFIMLLDMQNDINKYIADLSGGSRRKLTLAMALIGNPSLIIIDEPLTGVDPYSRSVIFELLRELQNKNNTSIVMATSNMDDCEAICDKIAILYEGQLKAVGSYVHLRQKYCNGVMVRAQVNLSNLNEEDNSLMALSNKKKILYDLERYLKSIFGSSAVSHDDESSTGATFTVKTDNIRKSNLFRKMQDFKLSYPSIDYSIDDTTLDDTFLTFAKNLS